MHSCKQPIPIMKYGNPAQIGDKVSVAAMGTRGDKRGWGVLPPPNTDPNWLLPRPETLFLAQLCSCSSSSDWNVLSSPNIFRKKRTSALKWLGGFLIYWYQNICSLIKELRALSEKSGIMWEKFPSGGPPPPSLGIFTFFLPFFLPFYKPLNWKKTEKNMEWVWVRPST